MATTYVTVPGQAEIRLPGNKSVEGVRAILGTEIPGLASMDGTITSGSATGPGDTRIAFTQRSGNKG